LLSAFPVPEDTQDDYTDYDGNTDSEGPGGHKGDRLAVELIAYVGVTVVVSGTEAASNLASGFALVSQEVAHT